jgi:hypothetical protein
LGGSQSFPLDVSLDMKRMHILDHSDSGVYHGGFANYYFWNGDDDAAILQMKMNNMGRKNSTRWHGSIVQFSVCNFMEYGRSTF